MSLWTHAAGRGLEALWEAAELSLYLVPVLKVPGYDCDFWMATSSPQASVSFRVNWGHWKYPPVVPALEVLLNGHCVGEATAEHQRVGKQRRWEV